MRLYLHVALLILLPVAAWAQTEVSAGAGVSNPLDEDLDVETYSIVSDTAVTIEANNTAIVSSSNTVTDSVTTFTADATQGATTAFFTWNTALGYNLLRVAPTAITINDTGLGDGVDTLRFYAPGSATSSQLVTLEWQGTAPLFQYQSTSTWTIQSGGDVVFQTSGANDTFRFKPGGVEALTIDNDGTDQSVTISGIFSKTPEESAPATCSIGEFYVDTSGAACACSATNTWSNMHATGSCV